MYYVMFIIILTSYIKYKYIAL